MFSFIKISVYIIYNMQKTVSRICGDGMLLAVYTVLSIITIKITPNLQITFTGLAIILTCVLYGFPDAILVATLGSFISQLRSTYGLTITTPIWMIPPILRALVFGAIYEIYLKHGIKLENKKVLFIIYATIAGLVVTATNTGAIFLDAYIFEYPVAMAVIESIMRFVSSILSSIAIGFVSLPIIYSLNKAGLIHERIKSGENNNISKEEILKHEKE